MSDAAIQKFLFRFIDAESAGGGNAETGASPKLQHITGADANLGFENGTDVPSTFVNVLEKFPWHNSPGGTTLIHNTPYIDLVEHDILANPMLNQIAANLAVTGQVWPDALKDEIRKQATAAKNVERGRGGFEQLMTVVDNGGFSTAPSGESVLLPYQNMYTTKPTGFRYLMPYFTPNHHQISNMFTTDKGETGSGMDLGMMELGEFGSEIGANIAKAGSGNIVQPGSYIEKSKYYSFSNREKSYQFSFPLSNSRIMDGLTAQETVSRNWQLVFLLIYQNSPNRMTRDLILPPCIYEAHIPGVWYSQYAYISQLDVEFLGTRRMETINFKNLDNSTSIIRSIIPDAYKITIGLTELVGESQNMLYQMSKGRDVITTGQVTD